MGIPRSTYYYRLRHGARAKARERADLELKGRIDEVHLEFPVFGYRKLARELRRRGLEVNEKRVRRIQRKYGLFGVRVRKFIRTTDSRHNRKRYPSLLRAGMMVTGLNEVWVADITYVRVEAGWVFVAVILDLCSRRAVGWAISDKIDTALCVGALRHAVESRKPVPGCIHHSDQGVQYASAEYVELLTEWGFQISMSRKGNPYDNAWAESFMKILKYEEVYLNGYETMKDVVDRLPRFIEEIYNRKRIHSSIGYLTPEEFERNLMRGTSTPEAGQPPQIL